MTTNQVVEVKAAGKIYRLPFEEVVAFLGLAKPEDLQPGQLLTALSVPDARGAVVKTPCAEFYRRRNGGWTERATLLHCWEKARQKVSRQEKTRGQKPAPKGAPACASLADIARIKTGVATRPEPVLVAGEYTHEREYFAGVVSRLPGRKVVGVSEGYKPAAAYLYIAPDAKDRSLVTLARQLRRDGVPVLVRQVQAA